NARGHSARVLDLIRHTHDFRITETGSELAAALLEARQIRELKPPYNRQRKHLPRIGFLKLTTRSSYPRLGVTRRLAADRATYLGPFRSLQAAERAQAVLGRVFGLRTCAGRLAPSPEVTPCLSGQLGACTAPCAARVDEAAYGRQVDGFLAFLEGGDGGVLEALAARRDGLAAALRFEAAGGVQRDPPRRVAARPAGARGHPSRARRPRCHRRASRRAGGDGARPPPPGAAPGDRRPRVTARRLVVTADDFGAAPEVNAAVVRAHS